MPTSGCKICQSVYLSGVNQKLREGWNAGQIREWIKEVSGGKLLFHRQTLYSHRDNAGGQHILNDVKPLPDAPLGEVEVVPVTNDEFLENIRDLAAAGVKLNPGQATLKMGLEAVKILEARKQNKIDVLVLARILTGQPSSAPMIEGEYREVPRLESAEVLQES